MIDSISDLHNERALLALCMCDPDSYTEVQPIVDAEDFYDRRHVQMWRAIQRQNADSQPTDPVSLAAALGHDLAGIGLKYLIEILPDITLASRAPFCAARLVQTATVRRTLQQLTALSAAVSQCDPAEWLARVDAFGSTPSGPRKRTDGESIATVAKRVWDAHHATAADAATGSTRTGIDWLDRLLGGGYANGLHVIAARPGSGKTALATQIAVSVARQQIGQVLFFCVEMPNDAQFQRLAAQNGPPLTGIETRNLSEMDYSDFGQAVGELGSMPITMFHYSKIAVEHITAEARRAANRGKVAMVVVDYYQRIKTNERMGSLLADLTRVSTELADLTSAVDAPVLALAQINRAVETEKRKPFLSDISDCSQLEKDAHTVLFPYLPAKMHIGNDPAECTMILAKHRTGATGATAAGAVRWDGPHVRFIKGGF